MDNILEEVKKLQLARGLTDSQIADRLGYHQRENWNKIKCGRAPANEIFQMRVMRAFPELADLFTRMSRDRELASTPIDYSGLSFPLSAKKRGGLKSL
ncbi:unnamed protein product, partial [marine sediment metagenome]